MSTPSKDLFDQDGRLDRGAMRSSIQSQMIRGAWLAAAVFFLPVLFIYAIYLVGELLPPESKEATDPSPDSFSSLQIERPSAGDGPITTV